MNLHVFYKHRAKTTINTTFSTESTPGRLPDLLESLLDPLLDSLLDPFWTILNLEAPGLVWSQKDVGGSMEV